MTIKLLKAVSFLLGHIPFFLTVALGRVFGALAYRLAKRHRRTALENIDRAFKDTKSREEKERIAKKAFENLSLMFFEFMRAPWLTHRDVERLYRVEGMEYFERALSRKKGVMLMTAHFGSWEMLPPFFGLTGHPLDIVARELDSPVADEFVSWVRAKSGNSIVSKRKAMRRLLRTLSDNGVVGILLDQNVTWSEGVFVDFFGTLACTNKGPALLAAASGAAIMPTFILREGRKFKVVFLPEIKVYDTGDREKDAFDTTARCTRVIEEMIRKHPDHWFWVHRRWKTRPLDEGKRPASA